MYTVYSPEDVIVTVNLQPVVGWESIAVEMAEDKNSLQVGVDGSFRFIRNLNSSGTVTIELVDYSPSNLSFTTSDKIGIPFVIAIIDKGSMGTVFASDACMVAKSPVLAKGKEGGNNSWAFAFGAGASILAGARLL